MDLKNLPARYTHVSNEMEGSKEALDMLKGQARNVIADSKPEIVEDIKDLATKPGFLTWKNNDEPWFKVKGVQKITGKDFALDAALQQKLSAGIQKQGVPIKEFPNVKPLVVQTETEPNDDDDDDKDDVKTELGLIDIAGRLPKLLCLAGVFGAGVLVGWWLRR